MATSGHVLVIGVECAELEQDNGCNTVGSTCSFINMYKMVHSGSYGCVWVNKEKRKKERGEMNGESWMAQYSLFYLLEVGR